MIAKKVNIEKVDSIRGYAARLLAYITNPEVAEDPDNSERLMEKSVASYFSGFSFCEPDGKRCKPDEAIKLIEEAKIEMASLATTCSYVTEGKSQPISHWILSFRERPTEAQLFQIGKEFMEDLGYDDSHQIAMSIHNNKEHLHLHIVANRVSQWDNKLLAEGNDWEKNEAMKACARAEKKYGLLHEEGNRFRATDEMEAFERVNPYTDQVVIRQRPVVKSAKKDKTEPALSPKAKSMEMRTGVKCEQRSLQEIFKGLEPQLKLGLRFGDLWRMLAERGVEVAVTQYGAQKGLAFSIDGQTWVKASKINPAFTATALEESLGTSFRKPQMRRLEKIIQKARADRDQNTFSRLTPRVNVEIPHTHKEIRQIMIQSSRIASDMGSKKGSGINIKDGIREIANADRKLFHGGFSGHALLQALLEMLCGSLQISMGAVLCLLSGLSSMAKTNDVLSRPAAKTGIHINPKEKEERICERLKVAGISKKDLSAARQVLLQMDALQAQSYIVALRHQEIVRGTKIDVLQALQKISKTAMPAIMPQYAEGKLFVFKSSDKLRALFEPTLLLRTGGGEIAAFLCRSREAVQYSSLIYGEMEHRGITPLASLPLAGFGGVGLKGIHPDSTAFESWTKEFLREQLKDHPSLIALSPPPAVPIKNWEAEQAVKARAKHDPDIQDFRTEERLKIQLECHTLKGEEENVQTAALSS